MCGILSCINKQFEYYTTEDDSWYGTHTGIFMRTKIYLDLLIGNIMLSFIRILLRDIIVGISRFYTDCFIKMLITSVTDKGSAHVE